MTRRIDKPDTDTDIRLREELGKSTSFVMIAGAGSGKTTSLVKALNHLEKQYGHTLRTRGQRIACITYTEVATEQIYGDVGHDPLFHVSTIHSFLWSLISPFQTDIKTWVGERIEEKLTLLKEEALAFGKRTQQKTRDKNRRKAERLERLRSTSKAVTRFTYGTGSDYENGVLGHDDIIRMVPALIMRRPLLRKMVAQKYPFFFVDESQDTVTAVVEALKVIGEERQRAFCLGFFGDPMQQIYSTGIGDIQLGRDWIELKKAENFRCSVSVLSVVNNIRRPIGNLEQVLGEKKVNGAVAPPTVGTARLFLLPAGANRKEHLALVREFMARKNNDALWLSDDQKADVKVLVLVHRIAANRLGFEKLYSALNDGAPEAFKTGLAEGTLWVLKPFLDVLLPLAEAFSRNDQFTVIRLLRMYSPRLNSTRLLESESLGEVLPALKRDVEKLSGLLSEESESTVLDVLQFVKAAQLMEVDGRFSEFIGTEGSSSRSTEPILDSEEDASDIVSLHKAIKAFLGCPAKQLSGYRTYIEEKSPYSTQHGIKGDEFERVLVVLDDDEARYNLYSYEKLFGLRPLSEDDQRNKAEGKESVLDRTRRLFYVCCSRAVKDLAVVLFTTDVVSAARTIREGAIFESSSVYTLEEMC